MNKLENQNDWWRCQNYGRELYHHGIKGQKWGIRRYQNPDGTLTAAGRKRYYNDDGSLTIEGKAEYAKKNFLPTRKKLVANGKSIYEVNPAALNAIEGNRLADRKTMLARLQKHSAQVPQRLVLLLSRVEFWAIPDLQRPQLAEASQWQRLKAAEPKQISCLIFMHKPKWKNWH